MVEGRVTTQEVYREMAPGLVVVVLPLVEARRKRNPVSDHS